MKSSGLQLQLLGGFALRAGSETVLDHTWPRRKAAALLKLLALQPSRRLLRDQILDALWPELSPEAAGNNLHKAAHYLRTQCAAHGVEPVVASSGLNWELAASVEIDVVLFDEAAAIAHARRTDMDAYRRALELNRGDLLPDDLYELWAEAARARYRDERARLTFEFARLCQVNRAWDQAVDALLPLRNELARFEETARELMRIYALMGRRVQAEEEFARCVAHLKEEYGLAPTDETLALHEEISSGRFVGAQFLEPSTSPLIGRDREQRELIDALDRACTGDGGVAMIAGEPGIGKTRLARELAQHAYLRGARTLWGRCDLSGGAPAFWPWMQLFADPSGSGEAASSLRPFDVAGESAPSMSAQGRQKLFEAVTNVLLKTARAQPLLIVLDDVHDADDASLQLLRFVARAVGGRKLLLLVCFRDSSATSAPHIGNMVAELSREHMRSYVALRGLTAEDVGRFVEQQTGTQPPASTVAMLAKGTGGNPLFLGECTRVLAASQGDDWPKSRLPIPPTLREILLQRLHGLPTQVRATLEIASIIGDTADLWLLRTLSERSPADLAEALHELEQRQLLRKHEGAETWAFTHGLIRETAFENIPARARAQLHERTAAAIEAVPGAERRLARLAYHYGQAARTSGDASKAIQYAIEAGDADIRVFAWEQAVEQWLSAASLMEATRPASDELAALLERCETIIFSAGGDYTIGLDCLRRALPIREALGQKERVAQIHSRLGRALSTHIGDPRLGRYMDLRAALDHYQQAAATFAEGPARASKVYFYAAMATTAFNAIRVPEGTEAAETAVAVANEIGSAPLLASALLMRGLFLKASGRLRDAEIVLQEAYDIADREQVPSLVYYAVTSLGDWTEGYIAGRGALIERELTHPRFAEAGMFRNGLTDDLISAMCLSGMLDRARALGASDAALAHWKGDWESAERSWMEGYSILVQAGARSSFTNRGHQLAELLRVRGDFAHAEHMRLADLEVALNGGSVLLEYRTRAELALLYAETRRTDEANDQLRLLAQLAPSESWGRRELRARLAGALLSLQSGVNSRAEEEMCFVAEGFDALGLPWDRAETYVQWARHAQQLGDSTQARAHVDKAHEMYASIGAGEAWSARAG